MSSIEALPGQPVLEVENLSARYGHISALSPISFSMERGDLVLVLGTNGAGKTTLVSTIAGLVPAATGVVRVGGEVVTRVAPFRRVRRGVSLVPEGRGTLPGLSVFDNLTLGWRAGRRRNESMSDALGRVLELFPVLGKRYDQDCSTLSGGEMQMLAIARALLSQPKVLLLDEPSLGLAPQAVAQVYAALNELSAQGLALVLVEQKVVPLTTTPALTVVLDHGTVIDRREGARPSEDVLADLYLGGRPK